MDCKRFRVWLTFREPADTALEKEARNHARTCSACARLLAVDERLEKRLKEELGREEVPARLRTSVARIAEEPRREKRRPTWPWLSAPASALAALLLFFFTFQPFGQPLTSLDQVARLAEQNHLAGYTMEFQAGEVSDISGWFRDKLDFEVTLPELKGYGLQFLGGRKCSLGREDTAYLFYAKDGKRYSLFELDAEEVQFEMPEDQKYRYPIGGCVVEVWKKADKVFVLVV